MLFNIFIIYRENTFPENNIYENQLKAEKPQNNMVPDKAMDGLAKREICAIEDLHHSQPTIMFTLIKVSAKQAENG